MHSTLQWRGHVTHRARSCCAENERRIVQVAQRGNANRPGMHLQVVDIEGPRARYAFDACDAHVNDSKLLFPEDEDAMSRHGELTHGLWRT